jgi:hypothetical protein
MDKASIHILKCYERLYIIILYVLSIMINRYNDIYIHNDNVYNVHVNAHLLSTIDVVLNITIGYITV